MSIKSRRAVSDALAALSEDIEALQKTDERHEKIMANQALEIAALQKDLMDLRNATIAAEANNRVPYDDISRRYGGISKGRISQIKKSFYPD